MGKTAELRARVAELRKSGVATFYVRGVDLVATGTAQATGEKASFEAWLATSVRAVFFLDAVDEVTLEGGDLSQLLLRFEKDVDPRTRPAVELVISSRLDSWSPDDTAAVVRALALPTEKPPVRAFALEPLYLDDVEVYARAKGVRDVKPFADAVVEEELDQLIELRPPDVLVLVDYWKAHGRFGSWSHMLKASIDASIREGNPRRSRRQEFTLEQARNALKRVAAACVLGKKALVSLPGANADNEVNAERLLCDLKPGAMSQLLSMGLFAQKGVHSVQLPQSAPLHYLAASWLADRARQGWDIAALEHLLFKQPFGVGRKRVPASLAPVVGWVASEVPALRKRLLRELPHALLFEGDPTGLSRNEVVEALRAVLADMEAGQYDVMPTRGTLRQLAKHDVADVVVNLLDEFEDCAQAERLLLRIAETGKYKEVAPKALRLTLTPTVDDDTADAAIGVVAAAGTVAQRKQLLALSTHPSESVRLALVQALAPEILNGSALVQLVLQFTGREAGYILGHALTKVALVDIDSILIALQPLLASSTIDTKTEGRVELASRLAVARLARGGQGGPPGWLVSLLLVIESHMAGPPPFVSSDVVDSLETFLRTNAAARQALWQARVSAAESSDKLNPLLSPRLGSKNVEDVDWLWKARASATGETVKRALEWRVRDAYCGLTEAERDKYRLSLTVGSEFEVFIGQVETAQARHDAAEREREALRAGERAALRAKNISEVAPLRSEIETGSNGGAMSWAWQHLDGTHSRLSRVGTGSLVESVGTELTEAFVIGFQRWWRKYEPPLPQPGPRSTPFVVLAGLTGLSLECDRGLDLATLSDEEVERAARYALYEINGFPHWFEALCAAHPARVKEVLARALRSEWTSTIEHHGIISRAPYEPAGTAELNRFTLKRDHRNRATWPAIFWG
jgi:hypothetical protein